MILYCHWFYYRCCFCAVVIRSVCLSALMIHCCRSFFVTLLDLLLSSVLFATFNDSLLSFVLLLPLTILCCHGRWRGVGWGLFITVTDSLLSVVPLSLLLILYSHRFFHQRYCVVFCFCLLSLVLLSWLLIIWLFTVNHSVINVIHSLLPSVLLSPLLVL